MGQIRHSSFYCVCDWRISRRACICLFFEIFVSVRDFTVVINCVTDAAQQTCWKLTHLLCLNSGSASFRGRIWRPVTSQRRVKPVPLWRLLQMQPSFPCFWRMHRYRPSWPHISRDSLRIWKRRKKERKWRHRVAWTVTFAGLGGRNHDVRVKHLVTQTGNAPKTRLSRSTTLDTVNKVSLKVRRPQSPSPSEDADPELRRSDRLQWSSSAGVAEAWRSGHVSGGILVKRQEFVSPLFAESETFSLSHHFRTLPLHTLATYSAIPHSLSLSHTWACHLWCQILWLTSSTNQWKKKKCKI